jgi:outer membrane protein W
MKSKFLVVLALSLSFAAAYAQSDEQVLNSDPINVDGYLAEKQVTDGELEQIKSEIRKQKNEVQLNKDKTKGFKELSKTTEKLSETTEDYLEEKKSAQKDIADYNAKIKCLMEENPGKDCDKYVRNRRNEEVQVVNTAQAAPAATSAAAVDTTPIGMSDKPFETIKAALEAGVINYTSDNEELRADTMGLRLESNLSSRFSMSVGANYTSFNTDDFANGTYMGYTGGGYYGNGGYGQNGREIQYKNFSMNFAGKFFLAQTERFRPYVGVGLGYNMANLRYSQNNPYSNGMYMYGDETYKTNFATGSLMLGTEIMITRKIGLNVMGSYSTGLGDSLSSSAAKNTSFNPDQRRLNQLGSEVIKARALSLIAGLLVVF